MSIFRTVITGSGCFVPTHIKTNKEFAIHDFYDEHHHPILTPPDIIVQKFQEITGIAERRYVEPETNSSDIAIESARLAIEESGIDPETLDQIIVAHNFGNVLKNTIQTDLLPALASRVKHALKIRNSNCVAYDVIFGCPGWLQGVIQADAFFKAGIAKKALVVGTETLSRVLDTYDRDSMIFSDGAGATVLEWKDVSEDKSGLLSSCVQSHCNEEAFYLYLGKSNFPGSDPRIRYIKMNGRKVYEYAMLHVPVAMKDCLDKAGVEIHEVKKIFIHQANEKMDEGILKRLYKLYGENKVPDNIMPMSIHELGNSSVATIPTLFDNVKKGKIEGHEISKGDIVLFASVGAGMNINAACYRI
jgi:3-oxoacyl-[acyl-carrier-protein] synthase-3